MALHGNPMRKLFDSLRMPGLGSEDDHPLANPREAQPIFAELRTRDSVKALEEISDWLQSTIAVESFKMERRFEVIRQLDDAIQPHRIKLAREYGAASSKPRPQEVKLWAIGRDLWANVAGAYDNLIGRIERKEKGGDSLRRESARIETRHYGSTTPGHFSSKHCSGSTIYGHSERHSLLAQSCTGHSPRA